MHEHTISQVTISSERYQQLLDIEFQFECLESVGVDNWEGYDEAMKLYRSSDDDE